MRGSIASTVPASNGCQPVFVCQLGVDLCQLTSGKQRRARQRDHGRWAGSARLCAFSRSQRLTPKLRLTLLHADAWPSWLVTEAGYEICYPTLMIRGQVVAWLVGCSMLACGGQMQSPLGDAGAAGEPELTTEGGAAQGGAAQGGAAQGGTSGKAGAGNEALGGTTQSLGGAASTSLCGDGRVQADEGEQCDDGNRVSGDGCSDTCQIEDWDPCPGGGPCVVMVVCGNGVVESSEQCDDGNVENGDGCDSECQVEPGCICPFAGNPCECDPAWSVCGDGVVQSDAGEQCDTGINDGSYGGCMPDCSLGPYCGDGVVQPEYEQCDDGNQDVGGIQAEGDTCTPLCTVQPGIQ